MGGACPDDGRCFDSHGVDFKLSSEWVAYEFTFDEFTQAGWGDAVGAFDPSQIYILEFQFSAAKPYEIWLDDVAFFEAGDQPVADSGHDSGVVDSGVVDSGVVVDGGATDTGAIDSATSDSAVSDDAAVSDSAVDDGGTADE
jgi:hypothetical protein